MSILKKLLKDEAGFVISTELVIVATILVIGMVVGLATVRDQVTAELADVAGVISEVNQSYTYYGITGHSSATAGSDFVDQLDYCDDNGQGAAGVSPNCVLLGVATNGATGNLQEGSAPVPVNP